MKRKLLAGLITLGAVSMLCGFDNAQTADDILQKMGEAASSAKSVSVSLDGTLDAGLNITDGTNEMTLAFDGSASFVSDMILDSAEMGVEGSYEFSALGSGQSQAMKLYVTTDEAGDHKAYAYIEDPGTGAGEWTSESLGALNIDQILSLQKEMTGNFGNLSNWGLDFAVASEAVDVDGKECYLLTATIDASAMDTMLQKSSELAGQDISSNPNVSMALSYIDGIKLNMEYYIDTTSFLPVKIHLDLNDSDFTNLSALVDLVGQAAVSEEAPSSATTITANDISLNMMMNYDTVSEITVPEEALAAQQ